jgi:hypothetical protein
MSIRRHCHIRTRATSITTTGSKPAITRHLTRGGEFELAANEPHAERYGADGATYRVARRSEA